MAAQGPKQQRVGRPGQRLSDPSGLQMTLVETPEETDGKRLAMEWLVPPRHRLVAADHYHPDGPEVWELLEGTAGYRLDGRDRTASAPHTYVVEAGTPHGHPWNAGADPVRVRQLIASEQPIPDITGGVQGFFETLFAFAQRGKVNGQGDIDGRLQNVLSIHDLLVPGTFLAGPPRWAQRFGLGGISAVARATGKRAYAQPEFDAS